MTPFNIELLPGQGRGQSSRILQGFISIWERWYISEISTTGQEIKTVLIEEGMFRGEVYNMSPLCPGLSHSCLGYVAFCDPST